MNLQDPAPASLLKHRPFVLYWNARIFSAVAFQMVGVAVGWQMYAMTGSAFDLGLVGLVQFLPSLVLVLVAGQLADRYDRRIILQSCQAVEALGAALLAVGTLSGWISKEFILAAIFLLGAGRAFEAPTNQTLLPAVVPAALFPRAVAASSTAQQVATITGPAIGGFLYLVSPTFVYAICFLLFFCAVLQLCFVRIERTVSARPPLTVRAVFAGVSYIWQNKIILGVMSLDLFAVLLGGATALLPIYAKDVFDVGPQGLGLLRAAPAVGALLVMASLAYAPLTRRIGRIEFAAVACFGVATIVFAVSTWFWLSMLALALLGASDAISVVIRLTLVQLETPDEMRGRVSSVNSLFVSMSNQIGDFRAGMAAAVIGAVPAVLIGGIGTLLVVLASIRAFPQLYAIEGFRFRKDTAAPNLEAATPEPKSSRSSPAGNG
jgi:MFS family permease